MNNANDKSKERIRMAIMTAKCDRPMVVDSEKAADFLSQKKNPTIAKKVEALAKKFEQNPNTKIQFGKIE